jgi:hypothetical protein
VLQIRCESSSSAKGRSFCFSGAQTSDVSYALAFFRLDHFAPSPSPKREITTTHVEIGVGHGLVVTDLFRGILCYFDFSVSGLRCAPIVECARLNRGLSIFLVH